MERTARYIFLRVIKMLNVLLMVIPPLLSYFMYYGLVPTEQFRTAKTVGIIVLFLILYTVFAKIYSAFLIPDQSITNLFLSQVISLLLSDVFLYVVIILINEQFRNPVPLLLALLAQIILSGLWCFSAHKLYFRITPPRVTAIVYSGSQDIDEKIIKYSLEKKYKVTVIASADDCLENMDMLKGIQTVFVKDLTAKEQSILCRYCLDNCIDLYLCPDIDDIIVKSSNIRYMFHTPIFGIERYNPDVFYSFFKRAFDIIISGVALVVLSPLFLLVSLLIKIGDGGPVFYKQERLTMHGRRFRIHKFRSMRVDAEKDGVARLSSGENDNRITPVGRFIRRCRLDELPQLLDILSGNMSIVGPRPERPAIAEQYCEELPDFQLRLQCKAGLTGLAQVYGKYNSTPYEKLQMDLIYITTASILTDLRICFATVKILFMPDSTEGIEKDQITAAKSGKDAIEKEAVTE